MAYPHQPYGPPPPGFQGAGGYPGGPEGYPGGPGGYPGGPGGYPGGPGGQGYPAYGQAAFPPPYGGQPYAQYPPPPQNAMPQTYNTYSANAGVSKNLAFSDKSIRNAFIRKVYSILMCQLALSVAFIAFFTYHPKARGFVAANPGLPFLAMIITIICLLCMACCESARRTTPNNYIFLFLFTLAESFLLGCISVQYNASEVVLAAGICAVICFGLTIFAFQTKIDFTGCGAILFVGVLIMFVFGILLMFWSGPKARLIYACCGAFLFSVYLVYDTQLMIGGNHKYSISPEEYVFAALNLYIDIVNIFIYILSILGSNRD